MPRPNGGSPAQVGVGQGFRLKHHELPCAYGVEGNSRTAGIDRAKGVVGVLPERGVAGVLASIHAASARGAYLHLETIAQQILPTTAQADALQAWGRIFGITRKQAAPGKGAGVAKWRGSIPQPLELQALRQCALWPPPSPG